MNVYIGPYIKVKNKKQQFTEKVWGNPITKVEHNEGFAYDPVLGDKLGWFDLVYFKTLKVESTNPDVFFELEDSDGYTFLGLNLPSKLEYSRLMDDCSQWMDASEYAQLQGNFYFGFLDEYQDHLKYLTEKFEDVTRGFGIFPIAYH